MTDQTMSFQPFPLLHSQIAWERTGRPLKFTYEEEEPSLLELLARIFPCSRNKQPLSRGEELERQYLRQRRQSTVSTARSSFSFLPQWPSFASRPAHTPVAAPGPLLTAITEEPESFAASAIHTSEPSSLPEQEAVRSRRHRISLRPNRRTIEREARLQRNAPQSPNTLDDNPVMGAAAGPSSAGESSDCAEDEVRAQNSVDERRFSRLGRRALSSVSHRTGGTRSRPGDSVEQQHDRTSRFRQISHLTARLWNEFAHVFSRISKKHGHEVCIEMTPMPSNPETPDGREREGPSGLLILSRTPTGEFVGYRTLSRTPMGDVVGHVLNVERDE